MSSFECPECGGDTWGTDLRANTGHCHGCRFGWVRTEENDASVGVVPLGCGDRDDPPPPCSCEEAVWLRGEVERIAALYREERDAHDRLLEEAELASEHIQKQRSRAEAAEQRIHELERRRIRCQACGETATTDAYAEALERAEKAEAEVERLRGDLKTAIEYVNKYGPQLAEARAEIDQLKEALARTRLLNVMRAHMNTFWPARVNELRAEVWRLKLGDRSEAKSEPGEPRRIIDRVRSIVRHPLGTHVDYEPMDMIRDAQIALGVRVASREPCPCGAAAELAKLKIEAEADRVTALNLGRELHEARALLSRIEEFSNTYGAALKPRVADTYGEGVRDTKGTLKSILTGRLKP